MPCMSLRIPISLPFFPFFPLFPGLFFGVFFPGSPGRAELRILLGSSQIPAGFAAWGGFYSQFFCCFLEHFQANSSLFCPNFPLGSHFQEVFESLLVPTLEFLGFSISGNEDFAPNLGFFGNFAASPSPGSTGESGLNLPQAFLGFLPSQKILENPI